MVATRTKPAEQRIDGATYRVMMLDPETAEDVFFDLLRLAGPTLAGMLGKMEGNGIQAGLKSLADMQLNSDVIVGALREFSASFDKALYHDVCRRLAEVTLVSIDGKKWPPLSEVQGELFRGKLPTKWKWLAFAVKTNFAGFFSDISIGDGPAIEASGKAESQSSSQQGSDGASGE